MLDWLATPMYTRSDIYVLYVYLYTGDPRVNELLILQGAVPSGAPATRLLLTNLRFRL